MAIAALRTKLKKNDPNLTISEGTSLRSFFSESKLRQVRSIYKIKLIFNMELIELIMLKHNNTLHNYIVYCYVLKKSTDIN